MQLLEQVDDPRLTTELARYNIEANLDPQIFGGDCLRRMEAELNDVVDTVRQGRKLSTPMCYCVESCQLCGAATLTSTQ